MKALPTLFVTFHTLASSQFRGFCRPMIKDTAYLEPSQTTGIASIVDELRTSARISQNSEIMSKRSAFMERQLESMTPEEELRFEFFVRSHFNKNAVKRILQGEIDCAFREFHTLADATSGVRMPSDKPIKGYFTTGPNYKAHRDSGDKPIINDDMAVAVCGLTKLFVGELCDTAVTLMKKRRAQEREEEAEALKKESEEPGQPKKKKKKKGNDKEEPEEREMDRLSVKDVEDAAKLMFDNGKLGRPRSKLLGAVDVAYLPCEVSEGRGIPPLPSDVIYLDENSEEDSSSEAEVDGE